MSVLDLFSLKGRVVLITGGSQGIGYAIAQALGEAGGNVIITGRDGDRLQTATAQLESVGAKVTPIRGDVTNDESACSTVAEALERFGRIDVLVNNVGHGSNLPSESMPMDAWHELIELNLTSVFRMCRLVAPSMLEQGRGSIVNLGSISGLVINRPQWHAAYEAAKAGVHHLTRALAAEWADRGVRVNAIAPGFVKTSQPIPSGADFQKYWVEEVPMKRMADPSEIAPAALYLASDASTFTTGTVLLVDGGYTLW